MGNIAYVYIVECSDGTFYTGYTTDIQNRLKMHNNGKGAKYTRGRSPVILKHLETFGTKEDAMKREYAIKKLNKEQKTKLCSKEVYKW